MGNDESKKIKTWQRKIDASLDHAAFQPPRFRTPSLIPCSFVWLFSMMQVLQALLLHHAPPWKVVEKEG